MCGCVWSATSLLPDDQVSFGRLCAQHNSEFVTIDNIPIGLWTIIAIRRHVALLRKGYGWRQANGGVSHRESWTPE